MEISSSGLSFRISLVDIEMLRPHEEVVDSIVKSLAGEMAAEGAIRDPLIVDEKNFVILDGMHRFSSLKLLRCRFVPCCLVDYDSPKIRVGSWFRLFLVREADSLAPKLLLENGLKYSTRKLEPGQLHYSPHAIVLTANGSEFILSGSLDQLQAARAAVRLEKALVNMGYHVEYLSETAAIEHIRSGQANFVISLPIFTKEQIREFGTKGLLAPHKVTRHVIPSRPLHVNVPLEVLADVNLSQNEANRKIGELLSKGHVDRKPPGSVVDGRRYEEELLVFSD